MVTNRRLKNAERLLFLPLILLLGACPVQFYEDYDSRFAYHDEWHLPYPWTVSTVSREYSFIVMSDTHIGGDADDFAGIKEQLGDAAFIVITGDITGDGTREQLRRFTSAALSLGIPCYPVIGNHDIYTERGKPWREIIGSSSYRVEVPGGESTLFILDNAAGSFGADQLEWFERGLKNTGKHTFVFAHQNFFIDSSPPDYEQTTDLRERARVMALLKGRGEAMFMGHLHRRILHEYGGVRYIMLEAFGETKTFCRVRVSPAGVSYTFESPR